MHDRVISGLLLVVAVIHLIPISGFFGADRIASLYGISVADNNLAILMRHRAVLFGILGCLFAYAAFQPALQPVAFLIALVSVASFLFLAASIGDYNDAIGKVVLADGVTAIALVGAVVTYLIKPSS